MNRTPRPHDLLWGMTPGHLPGDAPVWAVEVLAAGLPVVVRRAPARNGLVPVGIRGKARVQRLATWMPASAISRVLSPEALACTPLEPGDDWVWLALAQIRPLLDRLGLDWGVTGSAAWQLATGLAVLHPDSDLDLLLRTPDCLGRARAAQLLARLEFLPCRVDLQLETPAGAIALREWASGASLVMLKACDGPRLVADPWWKEAA
ncbi:malonate decarboxylase holo-ACP synthase [Stutzerimonas tarimensis]|uniref:Phosphoribosyl-dephospho-CoA transferase n=1 Tax=Stutzerimonas tarimensis TaxID=1507735 RepID=A0ABV7T4W8_9GAMM